MQHLSRTKGCLLDSPKVRQSEGLLYQLGSGHSLLYRLGSGLGLGPVLVLVESSDYPTFGLYRYRTDQIGGRVPAASPSSRASVFNATAILIHDTPQTTFPLSDTVINEVPYGNARHSSTI